MSEGKKENQLTLFDQKEWWEDDWEGMPEYSRKDMTPFKTVYVHFKNRKDMETFSKLINQKISFKTKSVWYPEIKANNLTNLLFVDEE